MARAIVVRRCQVVVDRNGVGAASHFILVAHAVSVGVIEASTRTIEPVHTVEVHGIRTGPVFLRRVCIVVTRHRISTSKAGDIVTRRIVLVGTRVVVARCGIGTAGINAAAVIEVGTGVEVGRSRIGTTGVLARTVIGIGTGIEVGRRSIRAAQVGAISCIECRVGVVVVGLGIQATGKEARAIVHSREEVEVQRARIGATVDDATAVIVCRRRVVVRGKGQCAATDHAGPIIDVGVGIVVVRRRIRATQQDAGTVVYRRRNAVVDGQRIGAARNDAAAVVHHRIGSEVDREWVGATVDLTGVVVERGVGVVVDRIGVRAAHQDAAAVVHIGEGTEIDGRRIGATAKRAGAILNGGFGVVVRCGRICTTTDHARAILDGCVRIVVVGLGVGATRARQALTRPIVVGGQGVVIARGRIHASLHFVLVAHQVTIGIVDAGASAIHIVGTEEVGGESATAVVVIGCWIVIASAHLCAPTIEARAIIGVGSGVEVVRIGCCATEVLTGVIVNVGTGIVIVGFSIRATGQHTGAIVQVRTTVVVVCFWVCTAWVEARAVIRIRPGLKIGRICICTSREKTGAVIHCCRRVVVGGRWRSATRVIAGTVVGIGQGIVVAGQGVRATEENTAAIKDGGLWVVVVGSRVGATAVHAAAIVHVRISVVIVGSAIRATGVLTAAVIIGRIRIGIERIGVGTAAIRRTEVDDITQVVVRITVGEHLDPHGTAQITIGGELSEQHALVIPSQSIDCTVQDVPSATSAVIDGDVTAIFKSHGPTWGNAGHSGRIFLTVGRAGLLVQSHRHPAVVGQVGNEAQQQVRDHRRRHAPHSTLPESSSGIDLEGNAGEARHRTHKIRWALRRGIDPVGREARNAIHSMDFDLHAIAFRIRRGDEARTEVARAIVVRGQGIVVACRGIITAKDGLIKRITDAIFIGVFQAVARTVVFRLRINARAVFYGHVCIVIARHRVGTTGTADKVTAAVIEGRRSIVVARRSIGASSTTGVLAAAVIQRRRCARVASGRVGTTRGLYGVTQAVFVDVLCAIAVTIQIIYAIKVYRVQAGDGQSGCRVIIAGPFFGTSRAGFELTVVFGIAEVAGKRQVTTGRLHHRRVSTIDAAVHQERGNGGVVIVGSRVTAAALKIARGDVEDGGGRIVVAGDGHHTA